MTEKTMFAPAERATTERLAEERRTVLEQPNVLEMLDASPNIAGVLNPERQFILVNQALLELLGLSVADEVIGERPGEAIGCVHAHDLEGGCGTSECCRYCGAVQAIVQSQKTRAPATRDCELMLDAGDDPVAVDLRVTASPATLGDTDCTVLTIADVGAEKRRQALEQVFFHDVINTATTLYMVLDGLEEGELDIDEELPVLKSLGVALIDDVMAQRDLAAAERGELHPRVEDLDGREVLQTVVSQLKGRHITEGRSVQLEGDGSVPMRSDRRLLRRLLFNMLKNAVEAVPPGTTIRAGVEADGGEVRFWAWNPTGMARGAELHVFERSFSTKGEGHGLGTYSMKLLGERYLKGKVSFETSEDAGTTFEARFPRDLQGG